MNYLKTTSIEKGSAVQLAYQDYGQGQPIILIHGWPLSHAMWEHQVPFLVNAGYRVITYDRRGFGDSSKPWNGYTYNDLAKDVNDLIEDLELDNVILAGFSMGGGEVARYIGKYGTKRIAKAVLISSVVPFMLETDDNPNAVDISVFEGMKEGIAKDRPAFFKDFGKNFVNLEKNKDSVSQAQVDYNWYVACSASRKATLDCVDAFGKTDFRADCKKFDVPTLIVHGDDDAIVPVEVSGKKAAEIIKGAQFEVLKGAPHGVTFTHHQELNSILEKFIGD
ncbi:alpha/beta fold hydrolase [Psychroflexus planctonicus]|uniref:Arylesterase n=1 Tax=Psychroflexus planctonicus TaxID=1526575 RepID=A0ABQ1SMP3_9FLAO|nr:alpha/beta hydrolase [Psychroflexus planctonicus]GGE44119.1 arylesterase [Psychroflexus planctonicus]